MSRPRLLDLFCCQGGAGMGYSRAGFEVVGVDIDPQPNYPFEFHRADAIPLIAFLLEGGYIPGSNWYLEDFAAIHASPPCQFKTQMAAAHRNRGFDSQPDLLTPARAQLREIGKPYVIENVVGAKGSMEATLALHGGMFGLGIHRPRLFESNVLILAPRAPLADRPVGVYGERPQRNYSTRQNGNMTGKRSEFRRARTVEEARELMGMPWADWHGCKEAVPPAYTEFIGSQLLAELEREGAA